MEKAKKKVDLNKDQIKGRNFSYLCGCKKKPDWIKGRQG